MYLILFGLILSLAHFIGQSWQIENKRLVPIIRSFSAGVSTAYIFVILLPELLESSTTLVSKLLTPVLFGLTSFHLLVGYLGKNSNHSSKLWSERAHLFLLLLVSVGTSYVSIEVAKHDLKAGIVLVAVWFIHYLLMDIVGVKMKEETNKERLVWQASAIIAPIVGTLLSVAGYSSFFFKEVVFALTIGAIIYSSLHEEIPKGKNSRPVFFGLGVIFILTFLFVIA